MTARHKATGPRLWVRLLVLAFAVVVGAGIEHAVHELTDNAHPPSIASLEIVTVTPSACGEAIEQADDAMASATTFAEDMRDLHGKDGGVHNFAKGGRHYKDSLDHIAALKTAVETYEKTADSCKGEAS